MIISRIPKLMQDNNITMAELSRRTGLAPKTVVKLYYADFTRITIDVLDRLCEALHATPGDIFEYIPGRRSEKPALDYLPKQRLHPLNRRAKQAAKVRRTNN